MERARTRVVLLKAEGARGTGAATGFLAAPGLVVTAAHAVTGRPAITLWLNGVAYPARRVALHPEEDLAVLRLMAPPLQLRPVSLSARTDDLQPGEELVILAGAGRPPEAREAPERASEARGAIPARFRRHVRVRDAQGGLDPMLALEARVEHGDSGSPVLRAHDGAAAGVLVGRRLPGKAGPAEAFAVPAESLRAWLGELLRPAAPAGEPFYLFRDSQP